MESSEIKFGNNHKSRFFFAGTLIFLTMIFGAIFLIYKNWVQTDTVTQQPQRSGQSILDSLCNWEIDNGVSIEEELSGLSPIQITTPSQAQTNSPKTQKNNEVNPVTENHPDTVKATSTPEIDTTKIVENYLQFAETARKQQDYLANLHFLALAADLSPNKQVWESCRNQLLETFSALYLWDNIPVPQGVAGVITNSKKRKLIYWTKQNQIFIYDIFKHKEVQGPIEPGNQIWEVVFSPEGNFFLVRTADGSFSVWRSETGMKLCGPLNIDEGLAGVRFGKNEKYLIGWSMEGTIRIWSALSGQVLNEIKSENTKIREILFDQKNEYFFIRTYDKKYYLFNIRNYMEPRRKELKLPYGEEILGGEFSRDASLLLTWSKYGIQFWNTKNGKMLEAPVQVAYGLLDGAHFSSDASYIVWWDKYRFIRIARRGSSDLTFQPLYHQQPVQGAMFISNGRWLVSWDNAGQLYTWNYFRNKLQSGPVALGQGINKVEFLPDAGWLLVSGKSGRVFLLNPLTYQLVGFPMVHAANVVESSRAAGDGLLVTWAVNDIAIKIWQYSEKPQDIKNSIQAILKPGQMGKVVTAFTGTILNQNGEVLLTRPEIWREFAEKLKIFKY